MISPSLVNQIEAAGLKIDLIEQRVAQALAGMPTMVISPAKQQSPQIKLAMPLSLRARAG